jgi:hypothetical protein
LCNFRHYFPWHMYSICTVYVQYLYALEAYIYCTYTVHILYICLCWCMKCIIMAPFWNNMKHRQPQQSKSPKDAFPTRHNLPGCFTSATSCPAGATHPPLRVPLSERGWRSAIHFIFYSLSFINCYCQGDAAAHPLSERGGRRPGCVALRSPKCRELCRTA